MTRELRFAVIGGGHLGRIHAKLLTQVDGANLVAVCDPIASSASSLAQAYGVAAHQDYREAIPHVDAVIIASPTGTHAEIATALIQAGKHVFVEKPLTETSADAQRLANLAAARRLTLQVGHVERFNPAYTALDQFAVDVKYVEATRASRFPGRCLDVGVVMDLMIHDLDLVLSFTDAAVSRTSASGVSVVSDHEDIAEARLEFECGLVANLKASRISPTPAREMTIYSPAGFAQIDFGKPSLATVAVSPSLVDRTFDLSEQTSNPLTYAAELFEKHMHFESRQLDPRNAILDELHDFVISIQSGTQPIVDGRAGARAVTIAEQILQSIDERSWYGGTERQQLGPHASVRRRLETTSVRRRAA